MPVDPALVGSARPRQSPRSTHVNEPWTMRFAAGLGESAPQFLDNRGPLLAHPCFLAGALENPCMFLSVYAVGVTNREASAVVHASIDSLFPAPLRPGSELSTTFGVVAAAPRRSGVELTTQIDHSVEGQDVCRSRWGCVIMGQHLPEAELPPPSGDWPALPTSVAPDSATEIPLAIAPTAAHIWEACIQDPTHGRRLGEMISPHSDARVAEQAGFPARTLTGVCLLGMAVSALSRELGFGLENVRRIAAGFAAPVYIDTQDVEVGLRFWQEGQRSAVFFEVLLPADEEGRRKQAIRSGFVEWSVELKLKL